MGWTDKLYSRQTVSPLNHAGTPAKPATVYARREMLRFLSAYAKCGKLRDAAETTGIPLTRHYDWVRDEQYAAQYAAAQRQVAGIIEDEMVRRAVDGYPEGVYYRGELVATETRYSDQLLVTLAKGLMPDKYGKTVTEETGTKTLRVEVIRADPPALDAGDTATPQLASGGTDDS